MKQIKMISKVIVAAILFLLGNTLQAQQSRVDSVINLLNKCKSAKGLDTLKFKSAQNLIISSVLTDAQITQIEKAAEQFKKVLIDKLKDRPPVKD